MASVKENMPGQGQTAEVKQFTEREKGGGRGCFPGFRQKQQGEDCDREKGRAVASATNRLHVFHGFSPSRTVVGGSLC